MKACFFPGTIVAFQATIKTAELVAIGVTKTFMDTVSFRRFHGHASFAWTTEYAPGNSSSHCFQDSRLLENI
jgi:hypothetical protein